MRWGGWGGVGLGWVGWAHHSLPVLSEGLVVRGDCI